MKTRAEDKGVLTLDETIGLYALSRRKFRALIQKGGNSFSVKYYNGRTLILKPQFEEFLEEHPEIRRRGTI